LSEEDRSGHLLHRVMRYSLMSKGLDLRGVCLLNSGRQSILSAANE